ncbi:MAG: hypothetical protein EP330_03445 [Deltaproteobacteria bacterium]|nr:MAG: hypothetical protein EP330_03445 [Deltaproteobacteria bacterium]
MALLVLAACGDRCESLCTQIASRIEECQETDPDWASVSWGDLDARGRVDFARSCRQEWGRSSSTLATHQLEEALDLCGDGQEQLAELECSDLLDLYAPR